MLVRSMILVLSLAVSASIVSCSTPQSLLPEDVEEVHKSVPAKLNTKLSVEGRSGDIVIRTWEKDSIDVLAVKKTRAGKRELKKVKIELEQTENIVIRSDYSDKNARVSVHYQIKIPKYIIVNDISTVNGNIELKGACGDPSVETHNGKITVTDLNGFVTARSQNGPIEILGTTGVLDAETSNGSIRAEILHLREGGADFSASNGSIKLYIFPRLDADLEITASNGTVSAHGLDNARLKSSPKRVTGTLGKGGPRIYASTSNGNVDLLKLGAEE